MNISIHPLLEPASPTANHPARKHLPALRSIRGFSLLELSLSLTLLALVVASLLPLQRALENRRREFAEQNQMDHWMSHIEGFALSRRRLPCPAPDVEGSEQTQTPDGPCAASNGWLPWRAMGLARPVRAPFYAVASLETLGTPYAHTLTRKDGLKTVSFELLSASIFSPPDTAGSSPGTLPALLVKDHAQTPPDLTETTLSGMPCAGQTFLSVSAVALISSDPQHAAEFMGSNRCYRIPAAGSYVRMAWLSYERLIWLYVKAGLIGAS